MPTFKMSLKDDTVMVLCNIADSLKLPQHLTLDEKLAAAVDAIATSIDTVEEPSVALGEPLQLHYIIEDVLNPNISSIYTPPDTPTPVSTNLTWEDIIALKPDIEANGALDDMTKESILIVFNELPVDEWDTPYAKSLIEKTHYLIMYHDVKNEGRS